MGFFKSIGKVFKKVAAVALPVLGIAGGIGAIAGGGGLLGGIFGGGAAAGAAGASYASAALTGFGASLTPAAFSGGLFSGIAGAASKLFSGGTGSLLRTGGTLLNAFGSFQQASSAAQTYGYNAQIAATNAAEVQALYELQEQSLNDQIQSERDAGDLREEEIAQKRARVLRSKDFGAQAIARDRRVLSLSDTGIQERSAITQKLVATAIEGIDANAKEQLRSIDKQRAELVGNARAIAATSGIRIGSESVRSEVDEIQREVGFVRDLIEVTRELDVRRLGLQGEEDLSTTRQQLGQIREQFDELDQRSIELDQQLADALFDADFELRISQRNERLGIDRAEFNKKVLKKRKETNIEIAQQTQRNYSRLQQQQQQAAYTDAIGDLIGGF